MNSNFSFPSSFQSSFSSQSYPWNSSYTFPSVSHHFSPHTDLSRHFRNPLLSQPISLPDSYASHRFTSLNGRNLDSALPTMPPFSMLQGTNTPQTCTSSSLFQRFYRDPIHHTESMFSAFPSSSSHASHSRHIESSLLRSLPPLPSFSDTTPLSISLGTSTPALSALNVQLLSDSSHHSYPPLALPSDELQAHDAIHLAARPIEHPSIQREPATQPWHSQEPMRQSASPIATTQPMTQPVIHPALLGSSTNSSSSTNRIATVATALFGGIIGACAALLDSIITPIVRLRNKVIAAVSAVVSALINWITNTNAHNLVRFYKALPDELRQGGPLVTTQTTQSLRTLTSQITQFLQTSNAVQQCTILDLSHRDLIAIPSEIQWFRNLQSLKLQDNHITSLPLDIFNGLQTLTHLDLSDNQITSLPPTIFNDLQALTHLNLFSNSIASLPPEIFDSLQSLMHLDLRDNPLTLRLEDMLTLPAACHVSVANHHFSVEGMRTFVQQVRAQSPIVTVSTYEAANDAERTSRAHHGHSSIQSPLEQELERWNQEFTQRFSQTEHPTLWASHTANLNSLVASLSNDETTNLDAYLQSLRNTQDYQNATARGNVILRTKRMIDLACCNQEFRANMLALIATSLESCGDRMLIIFNEIEIQWHRYQCTEETELRQLAIRESRYNRLKEHAQQVIQNENLGDEIEIILYYHICLRDALDLPITTQDMLYPTCAQAITEEKLQTARTTILNYSEVDLLATSEFWIEHQKRCYPDAVQALDAKMTDDWLEIARNYSYGEDHAGAATAITTENVDPELRHLLQECVNYNDAALKIQQYRLRAIAQLGIPSSSSSAI